MSKKLKRAPLVEVIFELRWDISISPLEAQALPTDAGFDTSLAAFTLAVQDEFPNREEIAQILGQPPLPFRSPYAARYRYRPQASSYPLLQLGEGVMTVNDTGDGYTWDVFKDLVLRASRWLIAIRGEGRLAAASLRFIDAVTLSPIKQQDVLSYLSASHLLTIERRYALEGILTRLELREHRELKDGSTLELLTQSGIQTETGTPALIWQTAVSQAQPTSIEDMLTWLEFAHSVCSSHFKSSLSSEAYAEFDR
jgi:uncharacterized protein (TIGR04255 family)